MGIRMQDNNINFTGLSLDRQFFSYSAESPTRGLILCRNGTSWGPQPLNPATPAGGNSSLPGTDPLRTPGLPLILGIPVCAPARLRLWLRLCSGLSKLKEHLHFQLVRLSETAKI